MRGFSLVELSVVLVILGLLVGGVLAGKSLIRAAELRKVAKDYEQFHAALLVFKEKYFYLPGDMPNATRFWGLAAAGNACKTTPSSTSATCNGDGGGAISSAGSPATWESYRAWQHLANAGLIPGTYNGTQTLLAGTIHLPPSLTSGDLRWSGWTLEYKSENLVRTTNSDVFSGSYGNHLWIQGQTMLTSEEVWGIDTKLDDGKPGTGQVVVHALGNIRECTDTDNASLANAQTASYRLRNDGTPYSFYYNIKYCSPLFRKKF